MCVRARSRKTNRLDSSRLCKHRIHFNYAFVPHSHVRASECVCCCDHCYNGMSAAAIDKRPLWVARRRQLGPSANIWWAKNKLFSHVRLGAKCVDRFTNQDDSPSVSVANKMRGERNHTHKAHHCNEKANKQLNEPNWKRRNVIYSCLRCSIIIVFICHRSFPFSCNSNNNMRTFFSCCALFFLFLSLALCFCSVWCNCCCCFRRHRRCYRAYTIFVPVQTDSARMQ